MLKKREYNLKKYRCLICGCDTIKLGHHVKKYHQITIKEYYHKYILKTDDIPICAFSNCSNKVLFIDLSVGYNKYCSRKCEGKAFSSDPLFKTKISISTRKAMQKLLNDPERFSTWKKNLEARSLNSEWLRKVSLSRKGKKSSIATRKKISLGLKKDWKENYNKRLEVCRTEERNRKLSKSLTGRKLSETHCNNIAEGNREKWSRPGYKERVVSKIRKANAIKPTKPELLMNELLQNLFPEEYKYVGDGEVIIAGKNPDFININGQKKIIEVFGDYWHRNDSVKSRKDIFKPYGYKTLVIWESDLYEDMNYVENKVSEFHVL